MSHILELELKRILDKKLYPIGFQEDMNLITGRIESFSKELLSVLKSPDWAQEKAEVLKCGLIVHYIIRFIERMYKTYKKDRIKIIELKKKFYDNELLKDLNDKLKSYEVGS